MDEAAKGGKKGRIRRQKEIPLSLSVLSSVPFCITFLATHTTSETYGRLKPTACCAMMRGNLIFHARKGTSTSMERGVWVVFYYYNVWLADHRHKKSRLDWFMSGLISLHPSILLRLLLRCPFVGMSDTWFNASRVPPLLLLLLLLRPQCHSSTHALAKQNVSRIVPT